MVFLGIRSFILEASAKEIPYHLIFLYYVLSSLSGKIQSHSTSLGKYLGVSIVKSSIKILFLTLLDDTMIFAKASMKSYGVIKKIIDEYCCMSG